jgi:two-component system response regulator AtoC
MFRILVVDDDPGIRLLIKRLLRPEACEIIEAADGLQVLAILNRGEPFDVVISDLRMPAMGGIDFLDAMTTHYPQIPVIISSVHDRPEAVDEAIQKGAVHYLPKPFTREQLLDSLYRRP